MGGLLANPHGQVNIAVIFKELLLPSYDCYVVNMVGLGLQKLWYVNLEGDS